jgi:hypothetical protein
MQKATHVENISHLAVEGVQIRFIKWEKSSHQNKEDDSTGPHISHCTIIALVVKNLPITSPKCSEEACPSPAIQCKPPTSNKQ